MRRLQAGGATIHVAVDRSGSGIDDSYCLPPTLEVKAAIREESSGAVVAFSACRRPPDFLRLEEDDEAQLIDSPRNADLLRALLASLRPVWSSCRTATTRTPVTSGWRPCFAASLRKRDTPSQRFSIEIEDHQPADGHLHCVREEDAQWKAQLLRFHDSQHQRNLHARGHGFDERILDTNRQIAQDLACGAVRRGV